MNVASLEEEGFVAVDYPETLRGKVEQAMRSWQGFCGLPDETKRLLSGGDRLKDFGYMRRTDAGPHADDKELFHVVSRNHTELRARCETIANPRATEFVDAVDALIGASAPLIQEFARDTERTYGLAGFEERVMTSQNNWTFRYLHYFGGETLSNAHADRGGLTLHLYESDAGGEYFGFDGAWHPWPVSDRRTIIFPSMVLQHLSQGRLKALWHRVVPTETTKANGRYAMVAFIDFTHDFRYDDARKRLQDFPEGFNYAMEWSEFNGLFVPRT